MTLRISRTLLATVLTVLALAIPLAAWYVTGSREASMEAGQLEAAALRSAETTAERLSERLAEKLESLREAESRRPFYHYQKFFHDPQGASEGIFLTPSPLSHGPVDPWISCYFQLNSERELTVLASPNTEQPSPSPQEAKLRVATKTLLLTAKAAKSEVQVHVERMDAAAYAQNTDAQKVLDALRTGRSGELEKYRGSRNATAPQQMVSVQVSRLQWQTIVIDDKPTLVALRTVTAPQGAMLQGFLLDNESVGTWLSTARFPARWVPGKAERSTDAAVISGSADWHVSVFADHAIAVARQRAIENRREARADFQRSFWIGLIAAAIAGICVIGVVHQAERVARQRAQFSAAAAHELRTPLASLRMYAEMLADGLGDPKRSNHYASYIASEVQRLNRVVTNILGFTRLERGAALDLQVKPGDLAPVVQSYLTRQQPALDAAELVVEFAAVQNLPPVLYDPDAVLEILQNLLDNAQKYARNASNKTIHVALRHTKDGINLSVADHGPGLPADVQRKLFKPFVRGAQNDIAPGLGLGLAMVQRLAKAQHARIRYSETVGGGATFTVCFRLPDTTSFAQR